MPLRTSRLFSALARSFGIVGAPDIRALDLVETVQPVADADLYDYGSDYVFSATIGAVVAQRGVVQIAAGDRVGFWVRWINVGAATGSTKFLSIGQLPTVVVGFSAPLISRSHGIDPISTLDFGTTAIFPVPGTSVNLPASVMHSLGPGRGLFVGPNQIFVLQSSTSNTAFNVTLAFSEPTNTPGRQ